MAPDGAERAGAERAGAERAGAERAGAERAGAERAGAERAGAERAGAERAGAERAGAERAGASVGAEVSWGRLLANAYPRFTGRLAATTRIVLGPTPAHVTESLEDAHDRSPRCPCSPRAGHTRLTQPASLIGSPGHPLRRGQRRRHHVARRHCSRRRRPGGSTSGNHATAAIGDRLTTAAAGGRRATVAQPRPGNATSA